MATRRLELLQLNCQRSYGVMCDLGQSMRREGIGVAILQEPYVRDGLVSGLPDGMTVCAVQGAHPKAAVVLDLPGVDIMVMEQCTTECGVCVWVRGGFGELCIVSVYFRYGDDIDPYVDYLDLVWANVRGKRTVVGVDANAVSPMWYSKGIVRGSPSFTRGLVFEEWLIGNGASILNEQSDWFTFSGPMGSSDIDVTFCNRAGDVLNWGWRVDPSFGVSDHNAIRITMKVEGLQAFESQRGWSLAGADWEAFEVHLAGEVAVLGLEEWGQLSTAERVGAVYAWLEAAASSVLARRRRGTTARRVKWWTELLARLKRVVRVRRKAYQRSRREVVGPASAPVVAYAERIARTARLKREYDQGVLEYKRAMREAKLGHWKDFVAAKGNEDPWGEVYRICRGKGKKMVIGCLNSGGRLTSTWDESVAVLLSEFFPVGRGPAFPAPEFLRPVDLTSEELDLAMRRVRPRKGASIDGVVGEMVRALWRVAPQHMLLLYHRCLQEGVFPVKWKEARLLVLLKSPDKSRTDPRSYRPICLLSALGKVLEAILVARLGDTYGDFAPCQHGFVRGRSVETAWLSVKDAVASSDAAYVLGVFVDFRGAFDNLEWRCVLGRIAELQSGEAATWWNYFAERRVCVEGEAGCVWREVTRGCPQGSLCGPYIWNLMMDSLLRDLLGKAVKCVAYADDLLLLVEGSSRVGIERDATVALETVAGWGDSVGVSLAREKTNIMLLKGRLSRTRHPSVRLRGGVITYSEKVKYLGITVTERMGFREHLAGISEGISRNLGGLRRVMRKEWGLGRGALRVLYGGLFMPAALFGSMVWESLCRLETGRVVLLRAQRRVLYACLPVCRTVSTEAMIVLMGVLPWDLEVSCRNLLYKATHGIALVEGDLVRADELRGLGVEARKRIVRERAWDRWQERWTNSLKGRVTWEFVPQVRSVRDASWLRLTMESCFVLTGHGSMNARLLRLGLADSDRCSCGELEDWRHILCDCPLYAEGRDLAGWGILGEDGAMRFDCVLGDQGKFSRFCVFVRGIFEARKLRVQEQEEALVGGVDGRERS